MRHYEIVLLIHPDQSEQVPAMLERYKGVVTAGGGKVHRVEDWGRRQMAYMIQKLAKAHYLCINIECDNEVLTELETGFRFNDAVLRHLTVLKDQAETTPSVMMKTVEREEARKARRRRPPPDGDACSRRRSPRGSPMNRLVLQAQLVERGALRYTPAGMPAFDLSLKHESAGHAGRPGAPGLGWRSRRGRWVRSPGAWRRSNSEASHGFAGFLGSQRNGRGIVFHVTELD